MDLDSHDGIALLIEGGGSSKSLGGDGVLLDLAGLPEEGFLAEENQDLLEIRSFVEQPLTEEAV